jgi:type IV secretory pathway TraG/TraD family ATPase VirD4
MALILHTAAAAPQYGHFGALRWLLLSGVKNVQQVIRRSPSEVAQLEFEGWLRDTSEGFRYSVTAGLKTKLNPWLTDQVVALTETTDIDLDDLKDNLWTFYLAVPNRSRDSQLLGSLMLNFLIDLVLDHGARMKYRTAIMLDEFTNFGKISNIADFLAIVRKARIGLVLGFQNYYQLERVYDRTEAKIIFDQPATQVFFQQKKYPEAKDLSEALGRVTVEETTVSDSGRIIESVQGRALATPDELMRLERQCIAFTNDTPALKLPIIPPDAYTLALQYTPPEAKEHEVREFIRKRGRMKREEPEGKGDGQNADQNREQEKQERKKRGTEKKRGKTSERGKAPDMGDVWE